MKYKLIITIICVGLWVCNNEQKQVKSTGNETELSQKFEKFAKSIEESILKENYKDLNTAWDIELFKKKLKKNGVESNSIEGGEKYYTKAIYKSNNDLIDEVKRNKEFSLCKFYFDEKIPKAIYIYMSDLGLNFIEFVFSNKPEKIKIIDFYNFQMGEYYSETVKQRLDDLNKYGSAKGVYHDAVQLVGLAFRQATDKKGAKAWATISSIQTSLQKENYFQLKKVQLASMISNDLYTIAIEEFLSLNPKNQRLQLYYNQILFKNKDDKKQKPEETIHELEKIVGCDNLKVKWKQVQ